MMFVATLERLSLAVDIWADTSAAFRRDSLEIVLEVECADGGCRRDEDAERSKGEEEPAAHVRRYLWTARLRLEPMAPTSTPKTNVRIPQRTRNSLPI